MKAPLIAVPLLLLTATACSSLGTPADQTEAAELWQESAGHREWGYFDQHVGIQKGKSPHGKFVATYINDVADGNQAAPPMGSILVKENYRSEDPSTLDSLTVMKRITGYDPDNDDWFWARYKADGTVTHSGRVEMCIDCHFDARGDEFVFLND
jgi:hypothetical protein